MIKTFEKILLFKIFIYLYITNIISFIERYLYVGMKILFVRRKNINFSNRVFSTEKIIPISY